MPSITRPDLIFVDQDEVKSKNTRQLIRRHVMNNVMSRRKARKEGHVTCDGQPASKQHKAGVLESTVTRPSERMARQIYDVSPLDIGSLNTHVFDPFNTLPVPSNERTSDLACWHFYSPFREVSGIGTHWLAELEASSRPDLWTLALQDELLFHTLLCIAAERKSHVTRSSDRALYLHHRGESLRLIRTKLSGVSEGNTSAPDCMAVAIAQQAIMSIGDRDYVVAREHLQALNMVTNQHSLIHSSMKFISWTCMVLPDMIRAAATMKAPLVHSGPGALAVKAIPRPRRHTYNPLVLQIIEMLPPPSHDFEENDYRNVFDALYQLDTTFDRQYLEFQTFATTKFLLYQDLSHTVSRVVEDDERLTLDQGVILCAQLAAWSLLRLLSVSSDIEGVLVNRLHNGLLHGTDLMTAWQGSGAPLDSLLWFVFTINAAALSANLVGGRSRAEAVRRQLLETLRAVTTRMQIGSAVEFMAKVRVFPGSEQFRSETCPVQWRSIESSPAALPG